METNDSEIGRMEAPARNISQAEAPISQHMENIRKYNGSDLPPTRHRGGRGGANPWVGGGEGLRSYIYVYIYTGKALLDEFMCLVQISGAKRHE